MTEHSLGLALADGQRWVIRALDIQAEATVRELGKVMRLCPARGGRELCVVSGRKGARGRQGPAKRRLVCRLGPARNRSTAVFRLERIATALVEQSLAQGGLLLHGALAVRDGVGIVLAGPSGVGKSTASRRLPAPWRSLSDDCVLVVRDTDGRYWTHPWPTWSLLRDSGLVESWPLERAVPLKALMFLIQSPSDRAEPVAITPAAALIMESAVQLARTVVFTPEGKANLATCRKYLRAAWALAATVPAFRLQVSLTGRFWDEIERAVESEPQMDTDGQRRGHRTRQNSETGDQNAEPRNEEATYKGRKATSARRTRSVPEPPRRLLSGKPKPRLVRFQTRDRTFLKLVKGRRVVASVNDLLRDWYIRRPSVRSARKQPVTHKPLTAHRKP